MSIARFVAALHAADVELGWSDVRDCLWLATVLAPVRPDDATAAESLTVPGEEGAETGLSMPDQLALVERDRPVVPDPPTDQEPQASTTQPVGIYPLPTPVPTVDPVDPSPAAGVPIRLAHTVRALPDSIRIARELRPLKRRVPVSGTLVVDEDATVERVSETRLWSPVLTPLLGRWLDLHLVIDDAPSMVVWEPMSRELVALLGRMAAFRTVRTWRLEADRDVGRAVLRAPGRGRTDHDPREVIDPTGRSVVLLVSDCVGPGWSSGAADHVLSGWASAGPVALWQPLPARLWPRTSMRPHIARVTANRQAQPTAEHIVTGLPPDVLPPGGRFVGVPILSSRDGSPAVWADLLAAGGSAELAVRLIGGTDVALGTGGRAASLTSVGSPHEIIRTFRSYSSALAMRLAVYYSAIPLTLDTMRLAQQIMVPQSGISHLAEVFLGGLLEEVAAERETDDKHYDFVPGVREALLSTITRDEALKVLGAVADERPLPLTRAGGFKAVLLADPLGAGAEALQSAGRPFALVARTVLSRLGGDIAELATRVDDDGSVLVPDRSVAAPDLLTPVVEPAVVVPVPVAPPVPRQSSFRPPRSGTGRRLYRPLLFVGIGGAGCQVGADVERQLRADLCGPDGTRLQAELPTSNMRPYQLPGFVQFVYVDLNVDELRQVRRTVVPGPEHDIAARQTMRTTMDLLPPHLTRSDEVADRLRSTLETDMISWLPDGKSDPRIGPLRLGSGQLPTVGRAVLFETLRTHPDAVSRDLIEALRSINVSGGDLQVVSGGASSRVDAVDVFVAFSVAGGTGGGLFYDYVHLIADVCVRADKQFQIYPLVLLPSAFDGGPGGGPAAALNSGSALVDLFRLVDDQNGRTSSDLLGSRRSVISIRYPHLSSPVSMPPATVPTAFLFGRSPGMAREDVQQSMSVLVGSMIGSGSNKTTSNHPLSFADSVVNSTVDQNALVSSGVGRRGVSTCAAATLSIPLPELGDIITSRFVAAALDQLAATEPTVSSQQVAGFLTATGLDRLLNPEPVPIRESGPAVGYANVLRKLAERARTMVDTIPEVRRRVTEPIAGLAKSFDPSAATEAVLRRGEVDLLEVGRVLLGGQRSAGRVDETRLTELLEGSRGSARPPAGSPQGPPTGEGLPRPRYSRLRYSDPAVQAVVSQQDEWYAWRTRKAWNDEWDSSHLVWKPTWRRYVTELRAILGGFQVHAASSVHDVEQRSRALYRDAIGSSYLLPAPETGIDGLYQAVMARFAQDFGLAPGAREGALLSAVLTGTCWAQAYHAGRSGDPSAAVAVIEQTAGLAVAERLRPSAGGRPAIVPQLAELLASAAGRRVDGIAETTVSRFRQKVAGLLPDTLPPEGGKPLRAVISYPADNPDADIEVFLRRELTLPPDVLKTAVFEAVPGDSLVAVLLRTGMGVTEVPEVRRTIRSWHDAEQANRSWNTVAWRRRFGPDVG